MRGIVAIVRLWQMEGVTVVLGSATPSMESFLQLRSCKYTLLEMPERVNNIKDADGAGGGHAAIRAARPGAFLIFSPQLKEAITQRLERGEQTILFLNRRGFSTQLQCPLCGYVAKCPNCSVSLTFHRQAQVLRCHVCNHSEPVLAQFRTGNAGTRRYYVTWGLGTEKVE